MSDYSNLSPSTAPIVEVRWEDIKFEDNWSESDETVQPVEAVTIGYLLEDNPHFAVVASSYDYRDEQWGSVHAFPKNPPEIRMLLEKEDQ